MIELRVIAVGHGALLLGGATSSEARYRVQLTDAVLAVIAQAGAQEQDLTGGPSLRPAQVQARLRAGVSAAEVAREAGMDLAWVERWAGPVEAERDQVIRGALTATVVVSGERTTEATLEELVRAWLPSGVDPSQAEWSTARRRDGNWRVTLRVAAGAQTLTATWLWDARARRATPASARARTITGSPV